MNDLQVVEPQLTLAELPELNVEHMLRRVAAIERVIDTIFVRGIHFGEAFPGSDRDSLLQPGAEALIGAFRLVPAFEVTEEDLGNNNRRFVVSGPLKTPGGLSLGDLTAECSTLEVKYRYVQQKRICPSCGAEAIMKSRYADERTGQKGWYCNRKADGCGAKFSPNDEAITTQEVGRIDNPNPEDKWHTCRRMAEKRWLVAVARRTLALSSRFVDQEAAQNALFDWKRVAPLLRSLPGERSEKWNRTVAWCFSSFGKPPNQVTNLEGAQVIEWLSEQVSEAGSLRGSDFMESPEAEGSGDAASSDMLPAASELVEPPESTEPLNPTKAAAPLPKDDRKALEKALHRVGMGDAAVDRFGLPDTWTVDDRGGLAMLASGRSEPGGST